MLFQQDLLDPLRRLRSRTWFIAFNNVFVPEKMVSLTKIPLSSGLMSGVCKSMRGSAKEFRPRGEREIKVFRGGHETSPNSPLSWKAPPFSSDYLLNISGLYKSVQRVQAYRVVAGGLEINSGPGPYWLRTRKWIPHAPYFNPVVTPIRLLRIVMQCQTFCSFNISRRASNNPHFRGASCPFFMFDAATRLHSYKAHPASTPRRVNFLFQMHLYR